MIFHSFHYFLFIVTVFALYYLLSDKYRWIALLAGSFYFYLYSQPSFMVVPVLIILLTYGFGRLIEKTTSVSLKKGYYVAGLVLILGFLVFYKYIPFAITTFLDIVLYINRGSIQNEDVAGISTFTSWVLPLGISYLTFQSLGYLIEINRGSQKAEKNLGYLATYLLFFPKLLAGPIERAHHFLPQMRLLHAFNYDLAVEGLKRMGWGLFKKLVVANHLLPITDAVFNHVQEQTGFTLIMASFLYLVQLYADFSAYTDIAIGSAQLFGYQMIENFQRPYTAKSTTELWRRWHISLSTWFFEYIYNPIAINKRNWKKGSVVYALFITFLLLGLWHGAGWNFIIFGILQAIALSFEFLTQKWRKRWRTRIPVKINKALGIIYVLCFLSFSMIFFRSNSFQEAIYSITHLFTGIEITFSSISFLYKIPYYEGGGSGFLVSVLSMILMVAGDNFFTNSKSKEAFQSKSIYIRWAVYYCMLLVIIWFGIFESRQFIYYKF